MRINCVIVEQNIYYHVWIILAKLLFDFLVTHQTIVIKIISKPIA